MAGADGVMEAFINHRSEISLLDDELGDVNNSLMIG
jgi:hypothetical protein